MPRLFVPPALRSFVGERAVIDLPGTTVGRVLDALDDEHPGVGARLCEGDVLKPGLAVVVNGTATSLGLLQKVGSEDEIHILPAVGGG
jgi:sulfur-carrier protein